MDNNHTHIIPLEPPPSQSHFLRNAAIGVGLLTGAVIVAPYLLPVVGLTADASVPAIMGMLHGTALGVGLAGAVNSGIHALPLIGPVLSQGGLASAVAVGVTGIGGVLLGRFIEKKHNGEEGINWGKVIRYGALATSLLIALPSILTGLSVGITYIASVIGGAELATSAVTFCANTLGATGAMSLSTSASSALSTVSHLFTCGLSVLPASLAWLFSSKMDLDDSDKIRASIEIVQPPQHGKLCRALLTLSHANGKPVLADELKTVHTEKLYLFVVDQTLKDYHHLHPRPTGEPGVYGVVFTPNTPYGYSVWADVTTAKDNQNHKLHVDIPATMNRVARPAVTPNNMAQYGELTCVMKTVEPLQTRKPVMVEFELRDAQGRPVQDLQPVMGEYAHLVGFSENGKSLIHCHPVGDGLQFHLQPQEAGKSQFFLQIRRGGEDIFLPFGQQVKPPQKKAEHVYAAHVAHAEMPAR